MPRKTHATDAKSASVLIIDAAPRDILFLEMNEFIKQGLSITLNLNRVADPEKVKQTYKNQIHKYVNFNPFNTAALLQQIMENSGYEVLKSRLNIPFTREIIEKATASHLKNPLKIIAQAGVGTSHIDSIAAADHGVAVTNTPGSNANAVAEFVILQTLSLARNICFHNNECHQQHWTKEKLGFSLELSGKTLGIVGAGNIAQELIKKAKALGMHVLVFGSSRFNPTIAASLGVEYSKDLPHLLKNSDIVSIHVPLTPETNNLFSEAQFKMMKKNSLLINTSRGGIVDEHALAKILQSEDSNIAGVAIDTHEQEGEKFISPLIGMKNALLTPHIAGSTPDALKCAALKCVENIVKLLRESTPTLIKSAL